MIGAIIGDIAGSRFEFDNTLDYNFRLFDNRCSYTDDTICTLAVADAVLSKVSYKDSLVKWCKREPFPMGAYGLMFNQWIDNPVPYGSYGNGAAMRISPIGWLFDSEEEVISQSEKATIVSHSHIEGIKGAEAIALSIYLLRMTKDKSKAHKTAQTYYGISYDKLVPRKGVWCDTCQGCVPLAIKLFMDSQGFEDAIRLAVSYGGDSDTLGAIVGSLAEAYFGVPKEMEDKAMSYLPVEYKEVVYKFKKSVK